MRNLRGKTAIVTGAGSVDARSAPGLSPDGGQTLPEGGVSPAVLTAAINAAATNQLQRKRDPHVF